VVGSVVCGIVWWVRDKKCGVVRRVWEIVWWVSDVMFRDVWGGETCLVWGIVWWVRDIIFREMWSGVTCCVGGIYGGLEKKYKGIEECWDVLCGWNVCWVREIMYGD
jgi:hypothetical protein